MSQTNSVSQDFTFRGFQSPNYTIVPDELFDDLLTELSGAELKVLLYIVRRTFGFKKDMDSISLSQMLHGVIAKDGRVLDRGVGLSKKTLLQAINALEQKNIILTERRRSPDKGDQPTVYRLNIINSPRGVKSTPLVGEKLHQGGGVINIPRPWGKNYTSQETVLQETDKQQQHVVVFEAASESANTDEQQGITTEITSALTVFGISKTTADRLTQTYPADYILSKLEIAQYLADKKSRLVAHNPAGYLRKSIEEDYAPPKGYRSKAQRETEVRERSKAEQLEIEERRNVEQEAQEARAALYAYLDEQYPPTPIPGTDFTTRTAWQAVKGYLRQSLPELHASLLEDTLLVVVERGTAVIGTTNRFLCQYLASRIGAKLEQAFEKVLKQPLHLQFQDLTGALRQAPRH